MKKILLFLIICSIISCFTSKDNSEKLLYGESKKILNTLQDKVYINIYMQGDLSPNFKVLQSKTKEILTKFKKFSNKELDFEFVSISEKTNDKANRIYNPLSSQGIHPIWVENNKNYHKTYPYAVVNFREQSLPILLHNSLFYDTISELTEEELNKSINHLEYNFMESFYLVQQKEKKKIAFLTGNGQLDTINTCDIRNTLSKFYDIDFFDLRSFELDTKTNKPDIWKQIERMKKYECIVIAKPSRTFFEMDKFLIDQYIMNGGKTFWLVDGTTANMNQFNGNLEFEIFENNLEIDDYLSNYGAKINKDLIIDQKCVKSPVYIKEEIAYLNWQYRPILSTNTSHIIGKLEDTLLTDFVSSITITQSDKSTILLSSSEKSNNKNCGEKVSFDIVKQTQSSFTGKKISAVLLEGEFNSNYSEIKHEKIKVNIKSNKMILVSDGDIIANLDNPPNFYFPLGYYHFGRNVFDGNTNFILNSIQYMCDDEILIKLLNKTKLNEKR